MSRRRNNRSRRIIQLRESAAVLDRHAATIDLREATGTIQVTGKCRKATAKIIEGDRWGSRGYYPSSMLAEYGPTAWPIGTQMYLNHPTVTEEADRPERSLHDLAGKITSTPVYDQRGPDGPGLYADVEIYPHVAPIIASMHGDIGLSIIANGTAEPGTRDGRSGLVVTSISPSPTNSVDYVTRAGAGGKLVALLESARTDGVKPTGSTLPIRIREAGSVGAWFESRIHSEFTEEADDQYGWGQLNRDERIALSAAIGDALDAFVARLQSDAPQLYQRDRWGDIPDCPEPADTPTEPDTQPVDQTTPMQMNESDQGGAPPEPTPREEPPMTGSTTGEPTTPVVDTARIAALETQLAEALRLNEEATTRLAEAAARDLRASNETTARTTATRLMEASTVEARFRPATLPLIEASAIAHIAPLTTPVDQPALDAAVTAAIVAEQARLAMLAEAFGAGQPTGLGSATTTGVTTTMAPQVDAAAVEAALVESYVARGMSHAAAKLAVTGRPF
jgi:hypothetical protein